MPQAYGAELAQRKTTLAPRRDWVLDDYFAVLEPDSPLFVDCVPPRYCHLGIGRLYDMALWAT